MIIPPSNKYYTQWCVLFSDYRRFYNLKEDVEICKRVWQWLLDDAKNLSGILLLEQDNVIGFAHHRHFYHGLSGTQRYFLDDIFVQEPSRSKGNGRKLLLHVFSEAKRAGATSVRWMSGSDNTAAHKLHDQVARRRDLVTYDCDVASVLVD